MSITGFIISLLAMAILGCKDDASTPVDSKGWDNIDSNTPAHLVDIFFSDRYNGWAVGDTGTVLRTTNAGRNWSKVEIDSKLNVYQVKMFSGGNGYLCGPGLLQTTDDGNTWNRVDPHKDITETNFRAMFFEDFNNGWLSFDRTLFKTTDAGASWVNTPHPFNWGSILGIYFADDMNGWFCGTEGVIFHTTDGGDNWEVQQTSLSKIVVSIHFVDATNGWAVTHNGPVLRTIDAGKTWEHVQFTGEPLLSDIYFVDTNKGWISGYDGLIYHSENGGMDWTTQQSGTEETLFGIFAFDSDDIWSVGQNGTIIHSSGGGD